MATTAPENEKFTGEYPVKSSNEMQNIATSITSIVAETIDDKTLPDRVSFNYTVFAIIYASVTFGHWQHLKKLHC